MVVLAVKWTGFSDSAHLVRIPLPSSCLPQLSHRAWEQAGFPQMHTGSSGLTVSQLSCPRRQSPSSGFPTEGYRLFMFYARPWIHDGGQEDGVIFKQGLRVL